MTFPGADGSFAVTWPTVRLSPSALDREWAVTRLWDLGTTGVEEHPDGRLTAGFASEAMAREAAAELDPVWGPEIAIVEGDGWLDTWREGFEPFAVGPFDVNPAWRPELLARYRATRGRLELRIDPGRAFGTGAHPSTSLVLGLLPALVRRGALVLDVGCGSGILAVAAARLGAARVLAVDIDPHAVQTTAANAARNGVADVVSARSVAVELVTGRFDVVVANILAPVLIELAPDLVAKAGFGGTIVVSGLVSEQGPRVEGAFGLAVSGRWRAGNWLAVSFSASAPQVG